MYYEKNKTLCICSTCHYDSDVSVRHAAKNKNATNETTGGSAATTQTSAMESSQRRSLPLTDMGNTRNADEDAEESTGVIDGMINDVEKGVDDITGESNGLSDKQCWT